MFFTLSKITYFLLCPVTWILVLLAFGIFLKKAKASRRFLITAFVFFLFFTNSAIIDELLRFWEKPYTILKYDQKFEAGIVLGGGMVTEDNDYDRLIFRDNTDRFLQALELYKKGVIKKIIFCGGPGSLVFKETREAPLIQKYLIEIGVPESDIIIDSTSNNTHQNAVNCAAIINQKFESKSFLLITSALHMKRAKACFINEGMCITMYPTSKFVGRRRTDIGYYLIPNTEALSRWDEYIHEVIGYFVYAFMGYI